MLNPPFLFAPHQITQIQQKYKNIWVAYSGGVDSQVLLHLATQCFTKVHAIHINHNKDAEDAAAQQFCVQACREQNIALKCVDVDLARYTQQSFELAARNARRDAWEKHLSPGDLLLLAHHADDQAETILYRLLRGTGVRGLAGMRPITKLGDIVLMRPLLNVRKQDIIAYAKRNNLKWLEDKSNATDFADRNFLRNKVLPLIDSRWPNAINNIYRSATVCASITDFLDSNLQNPLQKCVTKKGLLNLDALQQHDVALQKELLRAWLLQQDINPSVKQIHLILREVVGARIDANPKFMIKDKSIRRHKNHLCVISGTQEMETEKGVVSAIWDINHPFTLPNGKKLDAQSTFGDKVFDKLNGKNLTVRHGLIGRKAKKIFQQYCIPSWERNNYPLIYADDRLISIVGLWNSPRF